jgi:hypothetical protein
LLAILNNDLEILFVLLLIIQSHSAVPFLPLLLHYFHNPKYPLFVSPPPAAAAANIVTDVYIICTCSATSTAAMN